MFAVARSLFWLTAAYLVIKPGVDLPDTAALSQQAMTAGAQVIASQVADVSCDSLQCIGGKAVVSGIIAPALGKPSAAQSAPVQAASAETSVPYPMPRPAWLDSGAEA